MLTLIIASAIALANPATRTQIDQFVERARPVVAAEVANMRMPGPNLNVKAMQIQAPAPSPQNGPVIAPEPVRGPNGEYRIRII